MGGHSKGTKCSVISCSNRSQLNGGVKFFRFPKPEDQQRLHRWKLACNDEKIMNKESSCLYSSFRICSDHFESKFLQGHYLRYDAIPTLNVFQEFQVPVSKKICVSIGVQTDPVQKVTIETQTDTPQLWNVNVQTSTKLLPKVHKRKFKQLPQVKYLYAEVFNFIIVLNF